MSFYKVVRKNVVLLPGLVFALFSQSQLAQGNEFQANWSPNNYKVQCFIPFNCLYDDNVHRKAEALMPGVVSGIQALNFAPPIWFGKKVTMEDGDDYIELYETRSETIASTTPHCARLGIEKSFIEIGSLFTDFDDRDYLLYYFMAHEFFHVLQNERAFFDQESCANVPGWIKEGTATAVGQAATRKQYPGVFPEKRDERVARNFAGLRRYDKPLNQREYEDGKEIRTGADIYYRTSSFWRHLAEAHHKGRYDFLDTYMGNTNVGSDWTGWLRRNIKQTTKEDMGLVFGGFLADYAGWGDRGYPGQYYGRRKWLYETFTGCEVVELNKASASDYVEIDLLPLSGKCIQVHASALGPEGFGEGESAAIQIAAVVTSGPQSTLGGLHLGLAASNDKERFHCAREVKKHRKKGVGKCIFVPDDGKIRLNGGMNDARVWNVIAQEKGDTPEERQETGGRKASLINLYTIGYTPTSISMRDSSHNNSDPVSIRVYFVLDVAKMKMEGDKKGTVGTLGEGSDPQTTLPKVNKSGNAVNSYSKPDQFQPKVTPPAGLAGPPLVMGKMSYYFVSDIARNADPGVNSIMVYPVIESSDGGADPYPLGVGQTGTYNVGFMASIDGEPAGGVAIPPEKFPGKTTVQEFTDLVFRASFDGQVCRLSDIETNLKLKETKPCRNPVPVSGEIVKAFAGSRLPGYHMVTERTVGTEIYREAAERGMAGWLSAEGEDPDESGETPSSPGGSSSGGGNLAPCACTCEERNETLLRAVQMKKRFEAGEEGDIGDFNNLMHCQDQCRSEYMICVMDEAEEREARKEQEKAQAMEDLEMSGQCDCSCDGLTGMQSGLEKLLKKVQSGDMTAMQELKKMGRCMSVCQNELMRCGSNR